MSTVAIIATQLTIDVQRTYRQRQKDGTDKIYTADFHAGDIVASKIYYDGYPKLDDPLQDDPGVLNHLYNHITAWEAYPLAGNRRCIEEDSAYMYNPCPYTFKDRLDFDTWCKENWDADYLYWIDGPMSLQYCELNHWDPENMEPGKIDYDYPNGPWVRFSK